MQLTKRSHIILSITVIFVVFASMFYFSSQIGPDTESKPDLVQTSVVAPDLYIGSIRRENLVNRFGVNTVFDELTFVNNGSVPINYVYYTLNDTYLPNFLDFNAKTEYESSLSYQEAQNGLFGYKTFIVYLNTPIFPMMNQTIIISTSFTGLYTAQFDQNTTNQLVFFNFNKFTFSPYPIFDAFVANIFPYRTFFEDYTDYGTSEVREEGTEIQYYEAAIAPFTEEIFTVEGHNNQYSTFEFTQIDRHLYMNPWGYIRVFESHQIKNTGDLYISSFEYRLPTLAYNITMFDDIGTIDGGTIDEESSRYTIELYNRAGINPNATKRYNLEYYLPLEEFFSRSYSISSLKMDLNLMNHNVLIKSQHTYLHLYAGKSIESTTIAPDSITYDDNSMILYFHHSNVISTTKYYLFVEYKESSFQLIARALLFSAILFIAFSLYAMIRTRNKSHTDDEDAYREEVIPEAELREFTSYYEEITAIRIDIKNLENDLSRKKIAKKAYSKQLKVLESKLKTTQEDIKPFKKLILNIGGSIAESVKRLDLREAELISNQDGIKLYDDRYKKGKLPSKQAYRTLRTQMVDNGEKIQRQIDRLINQLKTYLI